MALIKARTTVQLPPNQAGVTPGVGVVIWVDPDDPFTATALSVGHMVPVGEIPRLEPDASDGGDDAD